jgi:hypothetical protein
MWALANIAALLSEANEVREGVRKRVDVGLSVDELTPRDPKACEELAVLASIALNDEKKIKIAGKAMK